MKALLLIIDSFGVGALPDADLYGDEGANTALSVCQAVSKEKWPRLRELGFGNAAALLGVRLPGCEAVKEPLAGYGVMAQASVGKDTTTGHWEIAGIQLNEPFQTFPLTFPSFPEKLIRDFQKKTGYRVIGNKGASGTVIIEELGTRHLNGEGIIVYTSADSVLQIAAHEEVVGIEELYDVCETARELCDPYRIGRVIARPFVGKSGRFIRTGARKDFSIVPPERTILDQLQANGIETIGIGKIGDIFKEQGLSKSYHDAGNIACLSRTINCMGQPGGEKRFIFTNLVDTDMLYGHRRDCKGYHDAVQTIDDSLMEIMTKMSAQDLLIISADHGCDPGFKGTDHTREYVPLLVFQKRRKQKNLGIRTSFSDVAQSLASFFDVSEMAHGKSFL